ncbi:MAG: PDZ domain-containing protein [Patescibacteria group bacterium]
MKARIAPTSPAANAPHDTVATVWQSGQLQQPPRTPWARIIAVMVLVGLVVNVVVIVALGWYVHRFPTARVARFVPFTSTTTTTVVQSARDKDLATVPVAVQTVTDSAYAVSRNLGERGVYLPGDAAGYAWPLSSSGWLLTISGAWPADVKSLVIVPRVGQSQAVTATVNDPATPFIFLRSTDLSNQPLALAPAGSLKPGVRVWAVTAEAAFPRQLGRATAPRWLSSDRQETTWSLDAPVALPIGSAIVDGDGRMVGLLGSDSRVWSVEALESVLKQIVQTGAATRPVFGVRAINRSMATVSGDPTAAGFLVGADEGQTAVTPKGPADRAGMQSGDILLTIDGQPPAETLFKTLATHRPGDEVKVTYRRQDQEKTVRVKLGSSGT